MDWATLGSPGEHDTTCALSNAHIRAPNRASESQNVAQELEMGAQSPQNGTQKGHVLDSARAAKNDLEQKVKYMRHRSTHEGPNGGANGTPKRAQMAPKLPQIVPQAHAKHLIFVV